MSAPFALHDEQAQARSRLWLTVQMTRLLKELFLASPVIWLATFTLQIVGNARSALYVLGPAGVVGALVAGSYHGQSVMFWIAVYVAGAALEEFYWTVYPVLSTHMVDHGFYRIHRRVLERAAAAPLMQYEEGPFFNYLQRAHEDMAGRLMQVWNALEGLVRILAQLGSAALVLWLVHPVLAPLLAVGVVPSLYLQAKTASATYDANRAHTQNDRIRSHLEEIITRQTAAQELRLFGSAPYLLSKWASLRAARRQDTLKAWRKRTTASVVGDLISLSTLAVAFILVVYEALNGGLVVGDYVAVAGAAAIMQSSMTGVVYSLRRLAEQWLFLSDLFAFFRVAREVPMEPAPSACTVELNHRGVALEAVSVSFSYPTREEPVIQDVSVRIAPGETVAIVGENGAGKTTLVKLLTGLYQPTDGRILFDDVPLTPERAVAIRPHIAAVFQDHGRYNLTVRENIGFGDLTRLFDDTSLRQAAQTADIDWLIDRLPQGLDDYVGRTFGDTDLSGGEWQRLALARAFFRHANLLVLDEPTSALDPKTELELLSRFVKQTEGRTTLMVLHRLGAARLADRILVMKEGRIVEEGTHDDLMELSGHYAAMFLAQATWYR